MNDLQIFKNSEFGTVRTVEIEKKIYFVGKDVATALGYKDTTNALKQHCRGVVKHHLIDNLGRNQEVNVIAEGDIYRLAVKSQLPSAEKFESWIFDEVLPSIRKHGMYAVDELLENPDIAIKAFTALKEEKERNKRLEQEKKALEVETIEMDKKISELQPKANYVDVILQSKSTVTITQIAQDYGMTANKLNIILRDMGIQRKVKKQWILYSDYQGNGYVHSHTVDIVRKDGSPDVVMNTEWTQKGRLFLYEELKKKGIYPMIEKCA